ncbi:UNVERIFIED_CONTAM: hypothetical protein Sangu_1423900 [Sesamum angustifolium]|uniref:DUF4283 domain-containing protein n=1 Tax=Sesamum angustifolium TaxID=2727405 RepID=A0AAW2N7B3_9LAMI
MFDSLQSRPFPRRILACNSPGFRIVAPERVIREVDEKSCVPFLAWKRKLQVIVPAEILGLVSLINTISGRGPGQEHEHTEHAKLSRGDLMCSKIRKRRYPRTAMAETSIHHHLLPVDGLPAEHSAQPSKVSVSAKEMATPTDIPKVSQLDFHEFISELEASPFASKTAATAIQTGVSLPAENVAATAAKTSFAGLFSANRKLTTESMLTKFTVEDGPLTLETNDLVDVRTKLGFCLVGYIAGKFARAEDRQRILAGGPYFVYGRPLLLKIMPDCFEFKEDDISLTPVWATLPSLPLECWHPNALGKIGSRLGTPIAMDSLTMKMERVSYARILVEVDASKKLVDHVEFILPNGVTRKQPVVYEYTPKFCSTCKRFGHLKESCQPPAAIATATVTAAAPSNVNDAATKTAEPKKAQPTEWTVTYTAVQQPAAAAVPRPSLPAVVETESDTDSSGSSNDPDSSASTQHLMPGAKTPVQHRRAENINSSREGTPLPHLNEDRILEREGIQPSLKQNGVAHLIKNNQLCLLGILETKLAATAIPKIINRLFPGWCQANNFDAIAGGRILIIWNPAVIDLYPEDISPQVIHCRVTNKSSTLLLHIFHLWPLYCC